MPMQSCPKIGRIFYVGQETLVTILNTAAVSVRARIFSVVPALGGVGVGGSYIAVGSAAVEVIVTVVVFVLVGVSRIVSAILGSLECSTF